MRVLGAIDMAGGNSIQARIRAVSQMTFTDEDGHPRQFAWRTIQKATARRNGERTVRTKELPVMFPDDPAVMTVIKRLMGW